MRKQVLWKLLCCLLLMTAVVCTSMMPIAGQGITQKESGRACVAAFKMSNSRNEEIQDVAEAAVLYAPASRVQAATPRMLARPSKEDLRQLRLYPGGMPFGVKFLTEGVTVVGFSDVETEKGNVNPAGTAGLKPKDVILKVNGETLTGASHLTDLIEGCAGKCLTLHCRRGKNEFDVKLTPVYCAAEARYKTGIWVRDSGAGIGTVTFIEPESGAFAGLGHGICDGETGELIPMKRGSVSNVTISSVVRGAAGAPGELKGFFDPGKIGALIGNSACGVWGVFSEMPAAMTEEPLPLGLRDEIEEGDAQILCTLDSNKIGRYDIKISNINRDANGSKCFTVSMTDPDLLAISGGIVQGMSGSPIIQNGKLVGAVTHVLINDPTTGYGIFIENMLNAAQMPIAKAS